MPGGDRTGPFGSGPRTGRAAGLCAGYGVPGYANPGVWCGGRRPGQRFGCGLGRGLGRGFGRGLGRGRGLGLPWSRRLGGAPAYGGPYEELEELRERLEALEARLGGGRGDTGTQDAGNEVEAVNDEDANDDARNHDAGERR